jgi:hypothetical protein
MQNLKEVPGRGTQHVKDPVVAGLLAEIEEHLPEKLQDVVHWHSYKKQAEKI